MTTSMTDGALHVTRRGRVLIAELDHPPLAVMDEAMVDALAALVRRVDREPEIGGVVLTGAHPTRFLAHFDVAELLDVARASPSLSPRSAASALRVVHALRRVPGGDRLLRRSPAAGLALMDRLHEALLGMQRSSTVWVAALNGSALGVGCEVALACDLRVMAAGEHLIGQPEIMLGIPPAAGGTQRLARLLGERVALRLVLDGAPLGPVEAADIGIVDRVVPRENLLETAIAEAERLGSRPKAAIGACKRAVLTGGSLPLPTGLMGEAAEAVATLGTRDAQRAMAAYVEQTRATGDLPAYDAEASAAALAQGRFA